MGVDVDRGECGWGMVSVDGDGRGWGEHGWGWASTGVSVGGGW